MTDLAEQMKAAFRRGWSRTSIGPLPWLILWHKAGAPEATWHRAARIFLAKTHAYWTWKWPKRLGFDNCSVCGDGPCGTLIGGEWLCPEHSVFVSKATVDHPGAALRVIRGGKR
jgi:hypothetical protein